jgi:hypothetical protein
MRRGRQAGASWPGACVQAVQAGARVGAWPWLGARPRVRAAHGENMGGGTTVHGPPRRDRGSIRRSAEATTRGGQAFGAHTCTMRERRPTLFSFHLPGFKNPKPQKLSTKLKFSKNKSCIGAIGLQLSQRATYVLTNGLSGNVSRSWQNSRPQVTVHSTFNLIFGQFALKI